MEALARNGPPQYHIISDGIFPLKTWLMNPFKIVNNMPVLERNFNYRLSSARMSVENAFGRLKGRWRVLLRRPDVHIETMRKIIYVCFLLHNFCEFNKQGVLQDWIQESELEEANLTQGVDYVEPEDNAEPLNASANLVRIQIARDLFHDGLSVS